MGRSAKFAKRPSKADREAAKINKQSRPRQRSPSPDDDAAAGPSAIPLFNTSAKGRAYAKDPRRAAAASAAATGGAREVEEQEPDLAMDESDGEGEGASAPAAKKKKGSAGLRDKVKKAKDALEADGARTDKKLGGGKKGPKKDYILGGKDYVALHEKTPGKKRFR
ncbi:hypothetical protein JCM10213_003831 [Rhodosporidiobolus nylandii]